MRNKPWFEESSKPWFGGGEMEPVPVPRKPWDVVEPPLKGAEKPWCKR